MLSHRFDTLVDLIPVTDQGNSNFFQITLFEASHLSQIFVARSFEISIILFHVQAL